MPQESEPLTIAEDFVEVDLPEGLDLPAADPVAAAPTPVPAAPAPAPAPPLSPAPSKEGNLGVALREARAETKTYKELWETTKRSVEERKAQTRGTVPPGPALFVQAPKFRTSDVKKRADEEAGATMGSHAELVLNHVEEVFGKFTTDLVQQLTQHGQLVAFNAALEGQRAACRLLYGDYDEAIEKAGFNEDLYVDPATRQFRNPELAAEIYRDSFPERKKYFLAKGRLEAAQGLAAPPLVTPEPASIVSVPVSAAATPPPVPAAPAPAAPASPAPEALRPPARGIRRIVNAGQPPRAAITREYLGWLLDHDYPRYEQLTAANPRLLQFHLGGIPLDQTA